MQSMKKDLIIDLTANEIDLKVFDMVRGYEVPLADLSGVDIAHLENEVKNGTGQNLYYQWLACLTRLLNPKQVVELGAASGISTIMMATELNKDSKLYTVDFDLTIAWKWMAKDYPQVIKILGNDLDMGIWSKDCDLSKTDLWFIDSLHTKEQLSKEVELYSPYWKKGSIVVFDDIRLPGMWDVWQTLNYDKVENTNPNHYSGFGFIKI